METIWEWATRSFTSPGELSAIELGATAAVTVWSVTMLAAVRYLTRTAAAATDTGEEYDQAA